MPIALKPDERMLDAGSGSGWVSRLVASRCPEALVTGIDVSPEFVRYAQDKASGLGNLDYAVGSALSLLFADATFDIVWSQFVLYFLPDPQPPSVSFASSSSLAGK